MRLARAFCAAFCLLALPEVSQAADIHNKQAALVPEAKTNSHPDPVASKEQLVELVPSSGMKAQAQDLTNVSSKETKHAWILLINAIGGLLALCVALYTMTQGFDKNNAISGVLKVALDLSLVVSFAGFLFALWFVSQLDVGSTTVTNDPTGYVQSIPYWAWHVVYGMYWISVIT
eukprot:g55024.t1